MQRITDCDPPLMSGLLNGRLLVRYKITQLQVTLSNCSVVCPFCFMFPGMLLPFINILKVTDKKIIFILFADTLHTPVLKGFGHLTAFAKKAYAACQKSIS